MKKKLLLAIGIVSILSSPVFAKEMPGWKLISHKEFITGHGKAIFKDLKTDVSSMPKFANKISKQFANMNQFIIATTHALPVPLDSIVPHLSGDYRIIISNQTETAQNYTIITTVGVGKILDNGTIQEDYNFAQTIDKVELEPHGALIRQLESELNVKLDDVDAKYIELVDSEVFNDNGDVIYVSDDSKPFSIHTQPEIKK